MISFDYRSIFSKCSWHSLLALAVATCFCFFFHTLPLVLGRFINCKKYTRCIYVNEGCSGSCHYHGPLLLLLLLLLLPRAASHLYLCLYLCRALCCCCECVFISFGLAWLGLVVFCFVCRRAANKQRRQCRHLVIRIYISRWVGDWVCAWAWQRHSFPPSNAGGGAKTARCANL